MSARYAARLLLVGVLVAGCSGTVSKKDLSAAEGSIVGLAVSGVPGTRPVVRMAPPLKVTSTQTDVVVAGTGDPIQLDQLFVLQLTLYDARTGKPALSTYDEGRKPIVAKSSDDQLFPVLNKALTGVRQGSRVVLAVTPDDAFRSGGVPPAGVSVDDPVVVVADVIAVPPLDPVASSSGKTLAPPAGAPAVIIENGVPSGVATDHGAGEPSDLLVVPLIAGTGPPVRDHSLVTLDVLGQAWGAPTPFENTFYKEPTVFGIGTERSVPAWDQALVGLARGSRVLVVAPAAQASAPGVPAAPEHATISWVIDVLGVS